MARVMLYWAVLIVLSLCTSASIIELFSHKLRPRSRQLDLANSSTEDYSFAESSPWLKLVEGYGYPAEAHEIETEDGYLLTVHRIPYGRGQQEGNRPIVLLHHGLLASSDCWILRGPDNDLAFMLADNGYDVWMSNARGNVYSRKHVTLDPDRDKKFWEYSFHEIGYYDLPATIDYALNTTGQESVFYLGHSMGCTVFFVLCSSRPEYNTKIRLMQGLAPAVFIVHKPSPVMKWLITNMPSIEASLKSQGIYELFPQRKFNGRLGKALCHKEAPTQPFCLAGIFIIAGIDYPQLNSTLLPVIFNYIPAGASLHQMLHFVQGIVSGMFRYFDFGDIGNMIKYHEKGAPEYDMKKVTTPVALFYGDGDFLINREDTEMLANKLPNLVGNFRVPFPYFNHLDFLWGADSKTLLYDQLLIIMNKYR